MAFNPQLGPQKEPTPNSIYIADMVKRREKIAQIKQTHTRVHARIKVGDEDLDNTVNVFVLIPNDQINNDAYIREQILHSVNIARADLITKHSPLDISFSTQTTRVI